MSVRFGDGFRLREGRWWVASRPHATRQGLPRLWTDKEAFKRRFPGAFMRGQTISAPVHLVNLIEGEAQKDRYPLRWVPPNRPFGALPVEGLIERAVEEGRLRPEVAASLRPWQRDLLLSSEASADGSVYAWWPGGAGKTRGAVVWSLRWPNAVKVVLTKLTPVGQWVEEFASSTGVVPWRYVSPTKRRKGYLDLDTYMRDTAPGKAVLVLHHEALPEAADDLFRVLKRLPYLLIVDEIHELASKKRVVRTVDESGEASYERRRLGESGRLPENVVASMLGEWSESSIGLTATPMMDRRRGLWGQLDILNPHEWGGYWSFAFRYCGAFETEYGMQDTGVTETPELLERLAYVIHQLPKEKFDACLPPLTRQVVRIPQSDQDAPLHAWKNEAKRLRKSRELDKLVELGAAVAASKKRTWLLNTALSEARCGRKVLLFTAFIEDVDWFQSKFEALRGTDKAVWTGTIQGATDGLERERLVRDYMAFRTGAEAGAILVGTYQTIGQSMNLQDTDVLVWGCLPWRPGDYEQGERRGRRLGQTRPLRVLIPVAVGTTDERIRDSLVEKLGDVVDVTRDTAMGDVIGAFQISDEDHQDLLEAMVKGMENLETVGEWAYGDDL